MLRYVHVLYNNAQLNGEKTAPRDIYPRTQQADSTLDNRVPLRLQKADDVTGDLALPVPANITADRRVESRKVPCLFREPGQIRAPRRLYLLSVRRRHHRERRRQRREHASLVLRAPHHE